MSTHPSGRLSVPSGDEDVATESDTRAALLERSNRTFAVVPKVFVQKPPAKNPKDPRGSLLSEFVRNGDIRGLRAYLLLSAIISSGEGENGWSTTLPISVWARAFDTTTTADSRSASSAASKILARLEDRKLIERSRRGLERKIAVTLLQPDDSGDPFSRATGTGTYARYLKLDNSYWLDGWYSQLDLSATAMLLVALHERPEGFELPTEHMQTWYGWSADTAERGLKKLVDLGLLDKHQRLKKAPLSPTGQTRVNRYVLKPPFAQVPIAPVASKPAPVVKTKRIKKKTTKRGRTA